MMNPKRSLNRSAGGPRIAVTLTPDQVEAAGRLHGRLQEWQVIDRALYALAKSAPGFGPEATLLKSAMVNALYGTNVFAIVRVARHVESTLAKRDLDIAGPDLVEELANVPLGGAETKPRMRRSFAAKFAHFFIDADRFPIFDKYADTMLRYHLGYPTSKASRGSYAEFCSRFDQLWTAVGLTGSRRVLDRYLWIAGQYKAWERDREAVMSGEVKRAFDSNDPDVAVMTGIE